MATLYTQSSAGGLFDGDRLALSITAEAGVEARLTTQASTIVHRTRRDAARHAVRLVAESGSLLEYLPDPTILFPESRLHSRIVLSVDETAQVILGDSYLAHDPDGRTCPFGWLDNEVTIVGDDGQLLVSDRFRVAGENWNRREIGVLGRYSAQATLMVLTPGQDIADLGPALRAALEAQRGIYGGVSELPNECGIWVRLIAGDGASLRSAMLAAWAAARSALTGSVPSPRRK